MECVGVGYVDVGSVGLGSVGVEYIGLVWDIAGSALYGRGVHVGLAGMFVFELPLFLLGAFGLRGSRSFS